MQVLRFVGFGLLGVGVIAGAVAFGQTGPTQENLPQPPGDTVLYDGHSRLYLNPRDQTGQLIKQYVKAEKEDDKKEIRKKLTDVLGKQFDAHMDKQQKELAELEKQIASLKTLLKKRQDSKSAIIEHRMDQLIRDAEGLGWNAPPGIQPGANFNPYHQNGFRPLIEADMKRP
jgi:flagellar motility protein MotE (MotC chaperone)